MEENDGLDDLFLEMDLLNAEIDEESKKIDDLMEWVDILLELADKLVDFNANMDSIHQGIIGASNNEDNNYHFLNGTLLVGLVSAYENFVHDFFDSCCDNKDLLIMAVSAIDKLNSSDKKHLRLNVAKEKLNEVYLRSMLKRVTLHDPIQIARISEVLFGLKMPMLEISYVEKLLSQRNAFTHRGGFSDGEKLDVRFNYLVKIHDDIYMLINGYVEAMQLEAKKLL